MDIFQCFQNKLLDHCVFVVYEMSTVVVLKSFFHLAKLVMTKPNCGQSARNI